MAASKKQHALMLWIISMGVAESVYDGAEESTPFGI
jgi:hypothetical protein